MPLPLRARLRFALSALRLAELRKTLRVHVHLWYKPASSTVAVLEISISDGSKGTLTGWPWKERNKYGWSVESSRWLFPSASFHQPMRAAVEST